jgi:hypothetical protein
MSAARVDTAVAKLQDKKIRQRAKMISRTECLLGDAMVSAAVVRAVHRRRYAGYVAEIMTADGRKLTATPNHPMLTDRGWVGAGALEHGDYLVCDSRNKDSRAARDMNVAMPPASLREIFETAAAIGLVERKATGEPDFHGDGVDGYVDIARPLRGLHLGNFASIYEPLVDLLLSPSDSSCFPFCRECSRLLPINECACICRRSPGDSELVEPTMDETGSNAEIGSDTTGAFASLVADSNVAGVDIGAIGWVLPSTAEESSPSIAECSGGDSSLFQGVENPRPVASELAGDGSGAEASDIELDRVVSVFLRPFSGHLFNLSTPDGYFTFNDGVYTGNTIDSLNAGVLEGWKEAERQGFLDTDEMGKKWIVTPDDRLCPICAPIPDQGVIHIEEKFATSAGEKDAPTAHPHCRCAIAMGLLPLAEAARLADPNFKNFDPGDIGPDGFRPTQADLEAAQQFGGQVNSEIDRLTRTYARLGDFEIDDIIIYNERTLASLGKPTAIGNYRQNKISLAWDRFNNVADELTIGPFTHVNGSLMGTARHEMAHGVWFHHMSLKEKRTFDDMFTRLFGARMDRAGGLSNTLVSQYAESSAGEFFAESMSAFLHPNYRKGLLPAEVENFFERLLRTPGKRHAPSAAEVAVGWDDAYNAWAKGASKLVQPKNEDVLMVLRIARNAARTKGVMIKRGGTHAKLLQKYGRTRRRMPFLADPVPGSALVDALAEARAAVRRGRKFHSTSLQGQLLTTYGPVDPSFIGRVATTVEVLKRWAISQSDRMFGTLSRVYKLKLVRGGLPGDGTAKKTMIAWWKPGKPKGRGTDNMYFNDFIKSFTGSAGTFADREVLAYKLSELWDLDFVPVTTYRKIDLDDRKGVMGSIQANVNGKQPEELWRQFPDGMRPVDEGDWAYGVPDEKWMDLLLFDAVTGNMDRHGMNVMIETVKGGGKRIRAIDNGLSFLNLQSNRTGSGGFGFLRFPDRSVIRGVVSEHVPWSSTTPIPEAQRQLWLRRFDGDGILAFIRLLEEAGVGAEAQEQALARIAMIRSSLETGPYSFWERLNVVFNNNRAGK